MKKILLKKHKEESVLRMHPWVFSGAIGQIDNGLVEGDLVAVYSSEGVALGVGHYQEGSISVRILEFGRDTLPEGFLKDRLLSAIAMRKSLGLQRSDNDTYRLVHGEGDFLPGLIVDVYGKVAVIQAHSAGMHLWRKEIAELLVELVAEVDSVYYKSEGTLPLRRHFADIEDGWLIVSSSTRAQDVFLGTENGLQFSIDWLRGQKTGFFVDQRENRRLVEHYARGRRVLNMFCYTGGFSVYALRGGAEVVHSVDSSEKAIRLVDENVGRNFPGCEHHESFCADAFGYLDSLPVFTEGSTGASLYDLIVLDPPAFAKHRSAIKNALQGYKRLNYKALQRIASGGILFTFSCSQAIDKDMFRLAVFSAAAMAHRRVRILHQLHQPQDHPVSIYHPEGEYLKGLVLYVE